MDLLSLLPKELRAGIHSACRIIPGKWYVSCAFLHHAHPPVDPPNPAPPGGLFGLSLAIAGSATYADRQGQRHALRPGAIFQFSVPPGLSTGRVEPEPGFVECTVCFDGRLGVKLVELGIWKDSFVHADAEPSVMLLQCYLELHRRLKSAPLTYDEALRGIIRVVDVAYAHAAASGPDRLITEACRLLGENVDPHRYSPRQAARDLNLTYRTFRELFARRVGKPPAAYQQQKRMELACEWLRSGTVKAVAARLGYRSPFLFSRQFKKVMGVSPKAFKRSADER
jgi:AraC-like DNA-binding protein